MLVLLVLVLVLLLVLLVLLPLLPLLQVFADGQALLDYRKYVLALCSALLDVEDVHKLNMAFEMRGTVSASHVFTPESAGGRVGVRASFVFLCRRRPPPSFPFRFLGVGLALQPHVSRFQSTARTASFKSGCSLCRG